MNNKECVRLSMYTEMLKDWAKRPMEKRLVQERERYATLCITSLLLRKKPASLPRDSTMFAAMML